MSRIPLTKQSAPSVVQAQCHTVAEMTPDTAPLEIHSVGPEKHDFESSGFMSKWDRYCAVKPAPTVPTSDDVLRPPLLTPLCLCELDDAAWEDDGSVQWNLATHQHVLLEGYASKAVVGRVNGIFPQDRQLVTRHRTDIFHSDQSATVGAARGIQ